MIRKVIEVKLWPFITGLLIHERNLLFSLHSVQPGTNTEFIFFSSDNRFHPQPIRSLKTMSFWNEKDFSGIFKIFISLISVEKRERERDGGQLIMVSGPVLDEE